MKTDDLLIIEPKKFEDYTPEDFERLDKIRKISWFFLSKKDKKFVKNYYKSLKTYMS
jgi:hypothetical protein